MPPVRGVTFCDASQIKAVMIMERAQGAHPRAKKIPRVKAPRNAECLEMLIEA